MFKNWSDFSDDFCRNCLISINICHFCRLFLWYKNSGHLEYARFVNRDNLCISMIMHLFGFIFILFLIKTSYLSHSEILIRKPIRNLKYIRIDPKFRFGGIFRKHRVLIWTKIISRTYISKFLEMIRRSGVSNSWSGTKVGRICQMEMETILIVWTKILVMAFLAVFVNRDNPTFLKHSKNIKSSHPSTSNIFQYTIHLDRPARTRLCQKVTLGAGYLVNSASRSTVNPIFDGTFSHLFWRDCSSDVPFEGYCQLALPFSASSCSCLHISGVLSSVCHLQLIEQKFWWYGHEF